MLTVVKPSPLRLWGFLLTVLGGAAVAFGSIADWAAVSIGGSTEHAVPSKGVDLWQGTVTAVSGALILVGILALRFVRPRSRNLVALSIVALGLIAFSIALWCVVALDSVVRDSGIDRLVQEVVDQFGVSQAAARRQVLAALGETGIGVRAQAGLWITLAGGVLATIGGVIDLAWVRQKRIAGDAIDIDTTSTDEPADPLG